MVIVVEGKKTWSCEAGKEHWLFCANNGGSDHLDQEQLSATYVPIGDLFS